MKREQTLSPGRDFLKHIPNGPAPSRAKFNLAVQYGSGPNRPIVVVPDATINGTGDTVQLLINKGVILTPRQLTAIMNTDILDPQQCARADVYQA